MASPTKQQCDKAVEILSDLEHQMNLEVERMRALCNSVMALLPANAMLHPLFQMGSGKFAELEKQGMFAVRDGILFSQTIMTVLDGMACSLRSDVSIELEEVRRELGQPSEALEAT